jgi:hypothetical protein
MLIIEIPGSHCGFIVVFDGHTLPSGGPYKAMTSHFSVNNAERRYKRRFVEACLGR